MLAVVTAAPCVASDAAPPARASLTKLSPANLRVLKGAAARPARQAQDPSGPSDPGSFFRSRKGAVALALVAGAIGFTIWAQIDSRKDVKSPVR